jgi:hypothetical protein
MINDISHTTVLGRWQMRKHYWNEGKSLWKWGGERRVQSNTFFVHSSVTPFYKFPKNEWVKNIGGTVSWFWGRKNGEMTNHPQILARFPPWELENSFPFSTLGVEKFFCLIFQEWVLLLFRGSGHVGILWSWRNSFLENEISMTIRMIYNLIWGTLLEMAILH